MPKKLAIIGASHFQEPLIQAAKRRGIETHVFAWQCGDVGEESADFFYPISITERDEILEECRRIGVDGVVTIGSDLGNATAGYVANRLGLVANSDECLLNSTNKKAMRAAFERGGDLSPRCTTAQELEQGGSFDLSFPVIVKPADRSGSRGVTKVFGPDQLAGAIEGARSEGFDGQVMIEEFARGREFSFEFISWEGQHHFLAATEKFTTGAPSFIEKGHLEPARLDEATLQRAIAVISHALDSLGVRYGASHPEIKIDEEGSIRIIEIGSRMGGDCIGSHLVQLSTGYDFVGAVIDVALGIEPPMPDGAPKNHAAIRFVFDKDDLEALEALKTDGSVELCVESPIQPFSHEVTDSSTRFGFYIFSSPHLSALEKYLPLN